MASSDLTDPREWRSDTYRLMRVVLEETITECSIYHQQGRADQLEEATKRLIDTLNTTLPDLRTLLDAPAKSASHRSQVERGTITVNGASLTANATFIKEALELADTLEVDEYLACSLLHYGRELSARFDRTPQETAVIIYHSERSWKLSCIDYIMRMSADDTLPYPVQLALVRCVAQLYGRDVAGNAAGAPNTDEFVDRLLLLVDALRTGIDKQTKMAAGIGGEQASFSVKIAQPRAEKLTEERRALATIIFSASFYYGLKPKEMNSLLATLRTADIKDEMTAAFLLALLGSVESSSEHKYINLAATMATNQLQGVSKIETGVSALQENREFLKSFSETVNTATWQVAEIGAVVRLQWNVFLINAVQYAPSMERELAYREDRVEEMIGTAATGGAFEFLTHYLLSSRSDVQTPSGKGDKQSTAAVGAALVTELGDDFRVCIQLLLGDLVYNFITRMHGLLRKIRSQEEQRQPVIRYEPASGKQQAEIPHSDVGTFFELVAALYADRPDAGAKFWRNERLRGFLSWGRGSNLIEARCSYVKMLGSLATGRDASGRAMDFMSNFDVSETDASGNQTTPISWTHLFGAIDQYIKRLNKLYQATAMGTAAPSGRTDSQKEMRDIEVQFLVPFLQLLRQVVYYSPDARKTIYQETRFNALECLFNLATFNVPYLVKAALFETIAAFCGPDCELGSEIALRVWQLMEHSQVLRTISDDDLRNPAYAVNTEQLAQSVGFGSTSVYGPAPNANFLRYEGRGGIKYELDEIESRHESYPETRAFLKLLNALIHTPAKQTAYRLQYGRPSRSVPYDLGAGSRQVTGILPYITYVVDSVLLKAGSRAYAQPAERWTVTEHSLALLERCLLTFDLSSLFVDHLNLPTAPGTPGCRVDHEHALRLMLQPGFNILARLLHKSQLLDVLLGIISIGVDTVNRESTRTPALRRSVQLALRLLWRVFLVQDVFIDTLLPTVTEQIRNDSALSTNAVRLIPPSVEKLDKLLESSNAVIIQIALYTNCHQHKEICMLAANLLLQISQSSAFNGGSLGNRMNTNLLVSLLVNSVEYKRILYGFMEQLETDVDGDHEDPGGDLPVNTASQLAAHISDLTPDVTMLLESPLGPQMHDRPDSASATRHVIMELLLRNLDDHMTPPTVSHLLLGFDVRGKMSETLITPPGASDAKVSLLHTILALLRSGTDADSSHAQPLLIQSHPALAVGAYQLIYRLCSSLLTSPPMLRYLREEENFFCRQLAHISDPLVSARPNGHIKLMDGSSHEANFTQFHSQLQQRTWLLRTVALQLHAAANTGPQSQVQRIVDQLFSLNRDSTSGAAPLSLLSQSKFETPNVPILALLGALDHTWVDAASAEVPDHMDLKYFTLVDFDSYITRTTDGCEQYDLSRIFELLNATQRQLEHQGRITTDATRQDARNERGHILARLLIENRRLLLLHARYQCLSAWKEVIEVILHECYDRLPANNRESITITILLELLPKMRNTVWSNAMLMAASSVVLTLQKALYRDQPLQLQTQERPSQSDLPIERLSTIFKGLIEAVQGVNNTIESRGNIYSAMLRYLQYCGAYKLPQTARPVGMSMFGRSMLDGNSTRSLTASTLSAGFKASLHSMNVSVMRNAGEYFLKVVCDDVVGTDDVWKTVAYSLLDALCQLWQQEQADYVLHFVSRLNTLQFCVESVRHEDASLQELLSSEMVSSNVLYVYDARMAFFLRLSQRRDGASKLIDCGIVEALSECRFLDGRPDFELAHPYGTDLAAVSVINERYNGLVTPALQLCLSLLMRLRDNEQATQRMLSFVSGHRDVLLAILKEATRTVTTITLHQATLAAAIIARVSQRPEALELLTADGYGSFLLSMQALLSKYCAPGRWAKQLTPLTDAERSEHKTIPASLDVSQFQKRTEVVVMQLCEYLMLFFSNLVPQSKDEFRPIFHYAITGTADDAAPTLDSGRNPDSQPSLGLLAVLLRSSTDALARGLGDHHDLQQKRNNIPSLTADELKSVMTQKAIIIADELNTAQKHKLVGQEMDRLLRAKQQYIQSTLFVAENALVLLFRHLRYYLDLSKSAIVGSSMMAASHLSMSRSQLGTSSMMAANSTGVGRLNPQLTEKLRTDANVVLTPTLNKLKQQALTKDTVGESAENRQMFIAFIARKILDLCYLGDKADSVKF